jgi:hypothetical protein
MGNAVVLCSGWDTWVPVLLFGGLGLPLVLQDLRDATVSQPLLVAVTLVWWFSACLGPEPEGRLLAAGVVLLLGALLLAVLPGRLGEADVAFMAGMASLLSFWPLMASMALACLAALSAFVWTFRKSEVMLYPLPFLPSLYWGGAAIWLGRLLL